MVDLHRVPMEYQDVVRAERAALWQLVERARRLADAGDAAAAWPLADEIRARIDAGNDIYRTGGHLDSYLKDIHDALGEAYDVMFPLRDPASPADVLDTPWPSASRVAALAAVADDRPWAPRRDLLVDRAVAAADVRLLRLLVLSPVGTLNRDSVVRVLDGLHAVGALDAEVVEHALIVDPWLGYAVDGLSPRDRSPVAAPAACAAAVRDYFDELTWRLTAPGSAVDMRTLPQVLSPRGLRFVYRALDWPGDPSVARHLGAAELTDAERDALVEYLRAQPEAVRRYAFELRQAAADEEAILPLLGLADATALQRLIRAPATNEVVPQDLAAIKAAVAQAGDDGARQLLEFRPREVISAAMGWNRAAVLKRVKNNALLGIAAYGLLPLADGETALDRYLALREVAKRGPKLGPNRRHSHAAAIDVALAHLAQVAGYPDASRLELDCESRIAEEAPDAWQVDGYTVGIRLDGADPVITVAKGGKELKAVPAAVRAHPSYTECRAHQERLRDQARRLRAGLIERLVATGGALQPEEVAQLRRLPAGAALLPSLIWQDSTGAIGLLDQVDQVGPLVAAHPFLLYERGLLAHWQAEVVKRRLRQPVKQAFRELYLLTPAEREAGDGSARFAGHIVDGKVAGQLLSSRGWSTHGEYDAYQATRPVGGGLTAALACEVQGYFGGGDVAVGEVRFLDAAGAPLPLTDVPPVAFSEAMRDLDLVVSVAGTDPGGYASPLHAASRAQLLAALIDDLGLARVSVEGTAAVVRGSRATYRVHLNSGSIHVEPGGYLCVVPAGFGATAHRRLFLPFADEDRMTSVILSKVLLLAEDEKITDPTILAQLEAR